MLWWLKVAILTRHPAFCQVTLNSSQWHEHEWKLRSLCCPEGSTLFLAMSYSFCSRMPSAPQLPRSRILPCTNPGRRGWMRSLWPQRTLTLEERGKSTHPRNAPLKLPTCSPRAGSKGHFCEHCSRCASCTCAVSRHLLRTFLVDVMKQINLGIPVLSNQHRVLGRMQAQASITQISHLAVVQGLPEL